MAEYFDHNKLQQQSLDAYKSTTANIIQERNSTRKSVSFALQQSHTCGPV
jgi:hypothetical protein